MKYVAPARQRAPVATGFGKNTPWKALGTNKNNKVTKQYKKKLIFGEICCPCKATSTHSNGVRSKNHIF